MAIFDEQLLLQERGPKWTLKNIQPGFAPQDSLEQPWLFAIKLKDLSAFRRGEITWQEAMERNKEKIASIGINVCPHYTLIEVCAMFIGITPEILRADPKFCGLKHEYENSLGPLSGFCGTNFVPQAMCRKAHDKLSVLISKVEKVAHVATPQQLTEGMTLGPDTKIEEIRALRESLDAMLKSEDARVEEEALLKNWRKVVFETCYVPESAGEIKHFHLIKAPEELGFKEVIQKAKAFNDSLMKNVLGNKRWFDNPAKHCPYAPQRDSAGIVS